MDDVRLLGAADPAPVRVLNGGAGGPILLVCDHAGRRVPAALGDLGVGAADWARHIAWDIGAEGVATLLAAALGAPCVLQAYSRLVIDCNRPPGHPTSIPTVSDGTAIAGNAGLSEAQVAARQGEIFAPYHAAIALELNRAPAAVVAVHSFTPVFGGVARPWQAGVLHNRDALLSYGLKRKLEDEGFLVGDNQPYRLSDDCDYTIPVHAEGRGLPYLELEIRQDLIASPVGQVEWAERLARLLPAVVGIAPIPAGGNQTCTG